MPSNTTFPVSVIVPHYNRPDFLRRALLSIHAQTLQPAEIIVVDDGSTPEAFQKVQSLSDLATIVRNPKNLGLSATRNRGVAAASAEWLAFLDDDDCYLPHKIEAQARYLSEHPECMAIGGGMLMRRPDDSEEYWGGTTTQRLQLADALCHTASTIPALMIRRDVFQRLGGFDTRLRNLPDYEFGIRLLAAGVETHFLAEPLFVYYRGGRDQLSAHWNDVLRAELRILRWHRHLCRREFGRFGPIRMAARSLRTHGLRKGRLFGRFLWLVGSASEAIFGKLSADKGHSPSKRRVLPIRPPMNTGSHP